MTPEEIKKIMEAIVEVYEKNGRKLTHAMRVDDVTEDGEIKGEVLIDETEKN